TPAPKKVAEQEYFLVPPNPWLDELGRQSFAILVQINPRDVPVATRPLALRFHDPRTLVIANESQIQEFLKAKGKFQAQSQAPSAPASAGAGKTGASQQAKQGNLMSGRGGAIEPKGPPGSTKGEETGPPAVSGLYLTIPPKLKKMMDRVDTRRP